MAYISQKCVNCEEHTRRCVRRFSACDENGEPFFCPHVYMRQSRMLCKY